MFFLGRATPRSLCSFTPAEARIAIVGPYDRPYFSELKNLPPEAKVRMCMLSSGPCLDALCMRRKAQRWKTLLRPRLSTGRRVEHHSPIQHTLSMKSRPKAPMYPSLYA
jgi:hypothetical protein